MLFYLFFFYLREAKITVADKEFVLLPDMVKIKQVQKKVSGKFFLFSHLLSDWLTVFSLCCRWKCCAPRNWAFFRCGSHPLCYIRAVFLGARGRESCGWRWKRQKSRRKALRALCTCTYRPCSVLCATPPRPRRVQLPNSSYRWARSFWFFSFSKCGWWSVCLCVCLFPLSLPIPFPQCE